MSVDKIKKLEKLVASAVEGLNALQTENIRLEQRVQELKKEKETALKENAKDKDSLEKLKQLEVSHRKLEKDRSEVRLKVQNVLQKIEKMDFV
ncbi:MAG: hypothetical protein QF502_02565 [Nitrospinaceae bacterium]|nr:hypothetical protein [Nitrospinaceae bacterium]HAK38164.1 hypothetical protein [Nitrospina sp.]